MIRWILAVALLAGCGGDHAPADVAAEPWDLRSWATFTALQTAEGATGDDVDQAELRWPETVLSDGPAAAGRLSVDSAVVRLSGSPAGELSLGLADGRLDGWFPEAESSDTGLVWDAAQAVSAPFLFARGAAAAAPPLRVEALGEDAYRLTPSKDETVEDALILRKHQGGWLIWPIEQVLSGSVEVASPPPKERVAGVARERVVEELERMLGGAGLADDEVVDVLDTWGERWIDREGVRVVFLAPGGWADRRLPLTAEGARSAHRVVLGRVEAMTPEFEGALLEGLRTAHAAGEDYDSGELGRFARPMLTRMQALASEGGEADLATYCERLAGEAAP